MLLQTSATAWSVGGTLALQGMGVADALQAVNRRSVVSGLADGTTVLSAQNSANGMVIDFSDVKAASGVLIATGRARLANRQVEAEVSVDLPGGLVGGLVSVPLRITGPVSVVRVSVSPGALVGAAVGTAVLPGIGTALGARLGAAPGKLFGNEAHAAGKPVPRKPQVALAHVCTGKPTIMALQSLPCHAHVLIRQPTEHSPRT